MQEDSLYEVKPLWTETSRKLRERERKWKLILLDEKRYEKRNTCAASEWINGKDSRGEGPLQHHLTDVYCQGQGYWCDEIFLVQFAKLNRRLSF